MAVRIVGILVLLVLLVLGIVYVAGTGVGLDFETAGSPSAAAASADVVADRGRRVSEAALDVGVARAKQVLFGDLHVHTTFSFDAFQMSLPMAGGDGAHPVSDACDYARHCSALDFWSINDHAVALTPRRWSETVDSIRQCNAVAGSTENPDTVAYLGWEWTQVGTTPETHWGHKNVVLRDLEDGAIPTRPISAGQPEGVPDVQESAGNFALGAVRLLMNDSGGPEFAKYTKETLSVPNCEADVPVRDLPLDCREVARDPNTLFAKLDDWGLESMVIPHGTSWGFYTPLGSAWDKQLTSEQHDPDRQQIVEVYSGHGNSEEFRAFEEVILGADGARSCPHPSPDFMPSCWRAGEMIEARCRAEGSSANDCAERAATARQHFVDAPFNGGAASIPGAEIADWGDSGQCRDCFQPAFNYRPKSSVQYMMALGREDASGDPLRFRFGFIASSDNHSARPGTGYKEFARTEFTEQRFGRFIDTPLGETPARDPIARSNEVKLETGAAIFSVFETERQASFFLNGGLAAVHAERRDRGAIWDALQSREVYGTSGPRILLWFDLLNAPGGRPAPMGSEVQLAETPIFQVRAAGSFEQLPGCPDDAIDAMSPEQLARLCQGECYHPSDVRRKISRIEIVRIRPQTDAAQSVASRVEDPWKRLTCPEDSSGCRVAFSDDEFAASNQDVLYYARAIEEPSLAVAADPLGCTRDELGQCIEIDPCFSRSDDDECLAQTEHRAWSSPIFVNHSGTPQLARR